MHSPEKQGQDLSLSAEETLRDRQRFGLNAGQWAAFHAALDAQPAAAPRLARLLNEPSVFERNQP